MSKTFMLAVAILVVPATTLKATKIFKSESVGYGPPPLFGTIRDSVAPSPNMYRSVGVIDTQENGATDLAALESGSLRLPEAWSIVVRLRAVDIPLLGGQAVRFATDLRWSDSESRYFGILFGTSDDGDPVVSLEGTDLMYEIEGGADAYHYYSFYVDTRPAQLHSSFSVAGQHVHSDYQGYGGPKTDVNDANTLQWGDLNPDTGYDGKAYWHSVRVWSNIPEPAGWVLLLLGASGLAAVHIRRL